MAKARSPVYPLIGLKEAIDKVGAAYAKDYQNKVPRVVLAEHMGYKTLNGKSLGVLSAVGKYGLIEGRGDESRVSDLAVTIIAHPQGAPERAAAIKQAASNPELFAELDNRFQGGRVSDSAIRVWMLQQKFIPLAADTALRSYRETKQLVEAESGGYGEPAKQDSEMQNPLPVAPGAAKAYDHVQQPAVNRLPVSPLGETPLRVIMNGDRLDIQASVDLDGLKKLRAMLEKYQGILEMMGPEK